jgi:hypothetical protein
MISRSPLDALWHSKGLRKRVLMLHLPVGLSVTWNDEARDELESFKKLVRAHELYLVPSDEPSNLQTARRAAAHLSLIGWLVRAPPGGVEPTG